jgi:hypothetical protein
MHLPMGERKIFYEIHKPRFQRSSGIFVCQPDAPHQVEINQAFSLKIW